MSMHDMMTVLTHLGECLRVHGSSGPVEVQDLGPLLISGLRLARSCRSSPAHQGSLASSLGSQSAPSWLSTRALQSLAQDTSSKT